MILPNLARADRTWDTTIANGSWNTPANWLGGVLPGVSDSATISFNDVIDHTITYDGSYSTAKGSFSLTNTGGGNTTLLLSSNYTLNTVNIQLGANGKASIQQSDGTINPMSMTMASGASDVATYNLSGGTLSIIGRLRVGEFGNATFSQSGGTLLLSGDIDSFYLGKFDGGVGRYELSGGTMIAASGERIGAWDSSGLFVQSGGTHINTSTIAASGAEFEVGPSSDAPSDPLHVSYLLNGGTLITGPELIPTRSLSQTGGYHQTGFVEGGYQLSGGQVDVIYRQEGANIQTGGTYNLGNAGTHGFLAGDNYSLSGGVMNVIGTESFGGGGVFVHQSATFNQSGGVHNLGTESAPGELYLGLQHGRIGTYSLNGTGVLNTVGSEFVGYAGSGSFLQSDGTHTLGTTTAPGQLYIAYSSDLPKTSRYRQTGGVFSVVGTEYVAYGGDGLLTQSSGLHTLDGNMYIAGTGATASSTGRGTLSHNGGTLAVTGTMKLWNNAAASYSGGSMGLGALDIIGGQFTIVAGKSRVLRSGSISTSSGGKIDLNDNSIIVDYADGGPSSESSIASQIQSGYANGAWNGPGINSSMAAVDPSKRIGYADNALLQQDSFSGETVDHSSVLVKLTWGGDANLDGVVNIDDLHQVAVNWNQSGDWLKGDFDYNGVVDVADLGIIARNWQAGESLTASETSFGLPLVDVPEPSITAGAVIGFCGALRSRRRRTAR